MKFLVVGDPHVQLESLAECERLLDLVEEAAVANEVDRIVLMGDLFHTFEVIRVEVIDFWRRRLLRLGCPVWILRGNHDGPHDVKPGVHALRALEGRPVIIDEPRVERNDILWLPFTRSSEEFTRWCKEYSGTVTVYCHQDFNGAAYENGIYVKNGVDPDAIPQAQVISGHIHTVQEFGKVFYVGAPRWMTIKDVNQDRFLWVIEHANDGRVISKTSIPTDTHCLRMVHLVDSQTKPLDPETVPATVKALVDVKGDVAYCEARRRVWKGKARVRTFPTVVRTAKVKESDGIAIAFKKYLDSYQPSSGVTHDALRNLVEARLSIFPI